MDWQMQAEHKKVESVGLYKKHMPLGLLKTI